MGLAAAVIARSQDAIVDRPSGLAVIFYVALRLIYEACTRVS
jgi:hypothetical protein